MGSSGVHQASAIVRWRYKETCESIMVSPASPYTHARTAPHLPTDPTLRRAAACPPASVPPPLPAPGATLSALSLARRIASAAPGPFGRSLAPQVAVVAGRLGADRRMAAVSWVSKASLSAPGRGQSPPRRKKLRKGSVGACVGGWVGERGKGWGVGERERVRCGMGVGEWWGRGRGREGEKRGVLVSGCVGTCG